jgi:hypothetical protein
LYKQLGVQLGQADALFAQATIALGRGRLEAGSMFLDQARELYTALGHKAGLSNIGYILAHLAALQGDLTTAIANMQPAASFAREIEHPSAGRLEAQLHEWEREVAQSGAVNEQPIE